MQYMLLIYSQEGADPAPGSDEWGPYMQGYTDFTAEMRDSGKLVAGDALQPVSTATTVSVRAGETHTVDGPFAETKEVLGGYYLLNCADLDDALAQAAKIPTAQFGRVEVRPLIVWD
jgi:hypothetical protein